MPILHLLWGAQADGGWPGAPQTWPAFPYQKVCYPSCPTCVSREIHWGLPATGNLDGQVLGEEVSHWVRREREPGVLFPPFVGTRTLACKLSYLADWLTGLNFTRLSHHRNCLNVVLPRWVLSQSVNKQLSSSGERVWDLIRTPEMDSGFWNAALGI